MKFAFTGQVVVDLHLRLVGAAITRQLRVNFKYTPSWPFFDPETGKDIASDPALKLDLEILARPRSEKLTKATAASREPYWTSASDLLALGVLNRRVYEQLNVMIDSDAHIEDLIRRHKANSGAPSLPNVL